MNILDIGTQVCIIHYMNTRHIISTGLALAALATAAPAQAQTPAQRCPLTPSQATLYSPAVDAQLACLAFPDAPCANRDNIIWNTAAMKNAGHPAEATGRDIDTWALVSCDVTADPAQWAAASPYVRCVWRVHEAGHLAGLYHSNDGGVMDGDDVGSYEPCRQAHPSTFTVTTASAADTQISPVERLTLKQALRRRLPAPARSWRVTCTRPARVMRCRATSPKARAARRFIVRRPVRVDSDTHSRYSIDAL